MLKTLIIYLYLEKQVTVNSLKITMFLNHIHPISFMPAVPQSPKVIVLLKKKH